MKGMGQLQESILAIIPEREPIAMSAIRGRMFPGNHQSAYARKAVGRAVKALIRRGYVVKLDDGDDPGKRSGRRVLLKAVLRARDGASTRLRA